MAFGGMRSRINKVPMRGGKRRRRKSMMPRMPQIGTSNSLPLMGPSDSMLDSSEHPPSPDMSEQPPGGGYFGGGSGGM